MKKALFLAFAFSVLAVGAMAQGKASYAGTWNLDAAKSKIDGPMRVESITLTVEHTAKDITITTATKRAMGPAGAPPAGGPPAGGPPNGGMPGMGGRGMGRGLGMMGDGTVKYSFEGKDTVVEVDGPNGKMPITYKASKEADGSLKLSSAQKFRGPNGNDIDVTRKETWKLSSDGTTLTVEREQSTPGGNRTSTLVFVKG